MRVAFKGFPLSIANGFASRGSPSPSGWDSPQGVPPLYSEWDSLQGGPLLQVNGIRLKGFPPLFSEWDSLHGGPLLQRMGFASWRYPLSRGSPSPSEWDSPQGVPPLHSEWDLLQGSPLLQSEWDSPQGVPLSNANESRLKGFPPLQCEWDSLQGGPLLQSEWDSLQGIPPLHSDSVSLQGTLLHLDISTHPVLRLRITPLRDPICGLLLPSIFPSKGDKEADESFLTAPVKAMIDFILKSFPDAQKSPYHPSSRSFEELQTLRFPRDRFWPSALRCQMPSLTLNRDSLIALRMEGYAILCCLLSTSSRRSPIRLLKEVS